MVVCHSGDQAIRGVVTVGASVRMQKQWLAALRCGSGC